MIEIVFALAIALGALAARLTGHDGDVEVQLWQLVTYSGAGLLAIGLVRDLLILKCRACATPRRAGEVLVCLESVSGVLLVGSGLGLCAASVEKAWHPALSTLGFFVAAVFVASAGAKDVVLAFKRERDHLNVIPW
ncbi:MAG TPA: hypothetical protein VFF73_15530 [Planctomycetota bacterium]|nr:hypothetical protein [Planctomycetota bacterium]